MLPLLLWLDAQNAPIGWNCDAEQTQGGQIYRSERSVEGGRGFLRHLEIRRQGGEITDLPYLGWTYDGSFPIAEAPRTIRFNVPLARHLSRAALRIQFPDGSEQQVEKWEGDWMLSLAERKRAPAMSVQSLDRSLNRRLWNARDVRMVVTGARGEVLGTLDMHFPAPEEIQSIAAVLEQAVDAKLAEPEKQCRPYGEEAYVDPV